MPSITATGVGSGIDVESIITGLVGAEGDARFEKIDEGQAEALNKISAYGHLSSVLSDFQQSLTKLSDINNSSFKAKTTTGGSSTVDTFFKAFAGDEAFNTSYNIKINDLAKAQQSSSIAFSNINEVVGRGKLHFTVNGQEHVVSIDASNNTVSGIAEAVSKMSKSTGVSASIIQTDDGPVLVFRSMQTGTNGAFSVTVTEDSAGNDTDIVGLSQLASNHLTLDQGAQNAAVAINGLIVSSQENTLHNVINGVTLQLVAPTLGKEYTLSIESDVEGAHKAVLDFVEKYNEVIDVMNDLTKYVPEKDREKTESESSETGLLIGDATLLNIQRIVRDIVYKQVSSVSNIQSLVNVGITTDEHTGHFLINEGVLNDVLNNNFSEVGDFFSDPLKGIAATLEDTLDKIVKSGGLLQSSTDALGMRLEDLSNQRVNLKRYLDGYKGNLTAQFSSMETVIARQKEILSSLDKMITQFVKPLAFRN